MVKITKKLMLETLNNKYNVKDIVGHEGCTYMNGEVRKTSVTVYTNLNQICYTTMYFEFDKTLPYMAENLEIIMKEYPSKLKELKQKYKEWLKTPEGKKRVLEERVKEFAQSTAVDQDEHGIYQSGDSVSIYVNDVVSSKKEMKNYFASGDFLALVTVNRSRTYSKAYTSRYGTGDRSDKYLIGANETGSRFAHQVPDKCNSLSEAIDWIWNGEKIIARHGDIAIIQSKTIKNKIGVQVENEQIIDSHVFSGEFSKNGSMYVRNGVIKHLKNQHPDVVVGSDWCKIIIAKRFMKGMGGTKD